MNDFGSVNIDADLVRSRSEDTLELSNGCVCCSLADGMSVVLERIRAMDPPPDRVLVEVSGVGDPATVAGWGDHPGFRRSAVLVCADVGAIRQLARDRWVADTVLDQLAGADLVLLTKGDLVPEERVEAVAEWLSEAAPGAALVRQRETVRQLLDSRPAQHDHRHGESCASAHENVHVTWTVGGSVAVQRAELHDLVGAAARTVVRVKGTVPTTGPTGVRRTIVNAVGEQVELRDDGPWTAYDEVRLVLIARGTGPAEPDVVSRLRNLLAGTRS